MTKNIRYYSSRILILLVIVTSAYMALPSSASAHAPLTGKASQHFTKLSPNKPPTEPDCYGSTCDGLDPFQTNCGASSSVNQLKVRSVYISSAETNPHSLGILYNYYSTYCNANWARAVMNSNVAGWPVAIYITTFDSNSNFEQQCEPSDCLHYYTGKLYPIWTNMVDGTNVTEAYAQASGANTPVEVDL